ncbi:hypothetical protein TSAR_016059 [Trichomalopsis sarcophagae]|uniref:Uncharacterized protein n=1 Tax=Trichomalopsis sarcophagae TaxID=543379 RepID=A0A232EE30_9HYME|nr:hypothetical protein TSAR_016059 [Trichomalopsis sarcophagae]
MRKHLSEMYYTRSLQMFPLSNNSYENMNLTSIPLIRKNNKVNADEIIFQEHDINNSNFIHNDISMEEIYEKDETNKTLLQSESVTNLKYKNVHKQKNDNEITEAKEKKRLRNKLYYD